MPPSHDPNWCEVTPWKCDSRSNGYDVEYHQNWMDNNVMNTSQLGRDNPFHYYFFLIFMGLLIVCIIGFCWRFYLLFLSACIKNNRRGFMGRIESANSNSYFRHHDNPTTGSSTNSSVQRDPIWTMSGRPPSIGIPGHHNHSVVTPPYPHSLGLDDNAEVWNSDHMVDHSTDNSDPPPSYAEAVLIEKYGRRNV